MNKNFNLGYILDILIYGAFAVFIAILQTTLLPRLRFFSALPDLAVGAVFCIGLYRNENYGAIFGLVTALFVDSLGSFGLSLLPLFYTLCGYVGGRVGSNAKENKKGLAFLISALPLAFSSVVLSFINYMSRFFPAIDYKQLFFNNLSFEFVSTFFACFIAFILFKLFDLPLYFARKRGSLY